jgi:hypothetical protein
MSIYLDKSPYYLNQYRAKSSKRARRSRQEMLKRGFVEVEKSAKFFGQMMNTMKNVKGDNKHFEIGSTTIISGLGMICILLSLAYLVHFTQVSTKGYELKRLEADRQQLLSQYEIKNMRLAEAQAMATIISSDQVESMRKARSVDYVDGGIILAGK